MKHAQFAVALAVLIALGASGIARAQTSSTVPPVYGGTPDLSTTQAFYSAGGQAGSFSSVRALTSALGKETLATSLHDLASTYGAPSRDFFVKMFDYAVNDAWERAGQDNLKMPASSGAAGRTLGMELVRLGTDANGTFWTSYMLDRMLSHRVHEQVMTDLDAQFGWGSAAYFERMANQFFYEASAQLGSNVGLAPLH